MRRVTFVIGTVAALAASYKIGQHSLQPRASQTARHIAYYVDPMHPTYKSDKPGTAPDCGMPLVPVFAEQGKSAVPGSSLPQLLPGSVSIDGATQRLLGIRLAPVEKSSTSHIISAAGTVVQEDTRVYSINSGVDGFIRETYNDSVGCRVSKNQRLASYYSPDFVAAASGFLAASERVPGSVAKEGARSIQNYTDRLRNLGMSDVQIRHVADTHQLPESIDVYAPADGFILARNISPGQHFMHDTEFYRIVDLSKVWVAAEIYQQEAPYLKPGTEAKLTLTPGGRTLRGRITDSLPQSEAGSGTVKLRLEVENSRFDLRPGMLVDIQLPVHLPPAVTVPLDALVDSGTQSRVYTESGNGIFEPHEVETGWRSGERVEILKGVQPGQQVVVSATFLIDSESRLTATVAKPADELIAGHTATLPQHVAAARPLSGSSAHGGGF